MREKYLLTTNDTEIFCSLCNRSTGSIVEDGEFFGFVICTICFGRTFISKHEVQHSMQDMFEMLRMGLSS